MVQSILRYLKPLRTNVTDKRTDRQTERLCHEKYRASLRCAAKNLDSGGEAAQSALRRLRRCVDAAVCRSE